MSVGLFDHAGEVRTTSTITMVEDVLITLGHFLNDCRDPTPATLAAWRVRHGSATVEIQLLPRGDGSHLRVASAVVHAGPATDRASLWQELLSRNADLCGVAFAIRGDQVLLVAERSTLDLDRTEVHDMIQRTATLADLVDDDLASRHGAHLGAPA
ncbi:MAG: YbjN domain-containing protein [Myxococcales bacterium]|nr:YbjN domain-containing protein [Myxococcales bacterium]